MTLCSGPSMLRSTPSALDSLDHIAGKACRRILGIRVLDEFDTDEESGAAHVAELSMLVPERAEGNQEVGANSSCVILEPLFLDDVQHGVADRGRHRVSTECVEVLHARIEGGGDLPGR